MEKKNEKRNKEKKEEKRGEREEETVRHRQAGTHAGGSPPWSGCLSSLLFLSSL